MQRDRHLIRLKTFTDINKWAARHNGTMFGWRRREEVMVAKATAMVGARLRLQRYRTAGETGQWLWVCVSALSILEQESFCSPFSLSFSLFENHIIAFPISPALVVVPSFPRPSFSLIHLSSFFLRLNPLDQANPPHYPPRLHLLSLSSASSSSVALYLPISISLLLSTALSVAQTLGHVYKAHRSPAFITRYEIAPRPRPGSPTPTRPVYALRTRRRRDIYWQTLRMSDHAGLRISNNIAFSYTLVPCASNPRNETRYVPVITIKM